MKLSKLFNQPRNVVVYAGRFCPMHQGHYGVYLQLVKEFGLDNVYIATSNKRDIDSPFSFDEKKLIATNMFNIPEDKFIYTKSPYNPVEILEYYNPEKDIYIAALGKKDAERFDDSKYFRPYSKEIELQPFEYNGYTYQVPVKANGISASKIRDFFSKVTDVNLRKQYFEKLYGVFNKEVFKLFVNKL